MTRLAWLPLVALLGCGLHPATLVDNLPPAPTPTPRQIVYIQPLGKDLPEADVELVKTALEEFFPIEIKILDRVELPREAWYPPRQRWRADKLLDFLRPRMPADGSRILGITQSDISTTRGEYEDWGVMGLGDLGDAASVISSFRCHKKSSGDQNARERLAKTAVHEMGHNFGLDHCPNDGCLMRDAEGQVSRSDQEFDICERCRKLLRDSNRPLPDSPKKLPWPTI